MVGVQDVRTCSEEEINWLKKRGRDLIEKTVRKFNDDPKTLGDFGIYILLPSDIMVSARIVGAVGMSVYRFGERRKAAAEDVYEQLKSDPDVAEAKMETAREFNEMGENDILIDLSWHGDETYFKAWQQIETVLPKGMFKNGL